MRLVHRADNLTTSKCRLSRNLGASTSWDPKGLSRPVIGLLFFFFKYNADGMHDIKYTVP
jgi:hypothetical protein